MSLYLEERICEQIVDPINDRITFSYPWIVTVPTEETPESLRTTSRFGTNYENGEAGWFGLLCIDKIGVHSITSYHNGNGSFRIWNGTCFISYVLYSSDELHSEFYTSPKIKMISTPNRDSFKTPDGKMAKFSEAFAEKKVKKMVIYIELLLPAKLFYRPFERSSSFLSTKHCFDVPNNFDGDFRFEFFNTNDFAIGCPDGVITCSRIALYLSSKYMRKYLMETNGRAFITEHLMDVIKPVIIFLHSYCFRMPDIYDLDFAKRLLKVVDFFNPQEKFKITATIHQSLCKKFVQESHDFNSILPWVSVASLYSLPELQNMLASVIVNKYYYKWHEIFPEAARNTGNQLFVEIFGLEHDDEDIFEDIEDIFHSGFFTNVILD